MEFRHRSVLLEETIEGLKVKPDGIYLDGTLGGGGHSSEILKRLKGGCLIGIDQDEEALAVVYGDDEKWATFTFRMTKPVAATWTANLTDGSHFELYSPTGMASGIGVGDSAGSEEGLVTFTIRPTQEYSVDETYETELYISVLSVNGEHLGEQEINPETHYPGTLMRIKIRQVSLDQWNGLSAQTQP